jgi:hypothetical protein
MLKAAWHTGGAAVAAGASWVHLLAIVGAIRATVAWLTSDTFVCHIAG